MLSLNQRKFITIAPMVFGPLSLVASISLITMIFKSASKLKIPVRRIFFGLCVYDCIYSFGQSMSTIPMPKDPGIWGTFGNVHSCNFQGFVLQMGFTGMMLYNAALSTYFVCVIRFAMPEKKFIQRIERFLHYIINVFASFSAIFLLVRKKYTHTDSVCWHSNKTGVQNYRIVFWSSILILTFAIIVGNMAMIISSVIAQYQKTNKKRFRRGSSERTSTNSSSLSIVRGNTLEFDLRVARLTMAKEQKLDLAGSIRESSLRSSTEEVGCERHQSATTKEKETHGSLVRSQPFADSPHKVSGQSNKSLSIISAKSSKQLEEGCIPRDPHKQQCGRNEHKEKEVVHQALFYVGSFLFCNIWTLIHRLSGGPERMVVILDLSRIFSPLQGLLNIFVYCRPHMITMRRRRPGLSWWGALWSTVKTGGDHNSPGRTSRRRKHDLSGNKIFLKRLEHNHLQRMEIIRRKSESFSPAIDAGVVRKELDICCGDHVGEKAELMQLEIPHEKVIECAMPVIVV